MIESEECFLTSASVDISQISLSVFISLVSDEILCFIWSHRTELCAYLNECCVYVFAM